MTILEQKEILKAQSNLINELIAVIDIEYYNRSWLNSPEYTNRKMAEMLKILLRNNTRLQGGI